MKSKVQVKGTLPLIADFLGTTEQRVYDIFDLNKDQKESSTNEKKGGLYEENTDKSKTVQASKNSV